MKAKNNLPILSQLYKWNLAIQGTFDLSRFSVILEYSTDYWFNEI